MAKKILEQTINKKTAYEESLDNIATNDQRLKEVFGQRLCTKNKFFTLTTRLKNSSEKRTTNG